MFIINPPATAGGTDLLQVQLLTFEESRAPKFVSMWDGVTGNASGFELEDEGSTPSPTASLSL